MRVICRCVWHVQGAWFVMDQAHICVRAQHDDARHGVAAVHCHTLCLTCFHSSFLTFCVELVTQLEQQLRDKEPSVRLPWDPMVKIEGSVCKVRNIFCTAATAPHCSQVSTTRCSVHTLQGKAASKAPSKSGSHTLQHTTERENTLTDTDSSPAKGADQDKRKVQE